MLHLILQARCSMNSSKGMRLVIFWFCLDHWNSLFHLKWCVFILCMYISLVSFILVIYAYRGSCNIIRYKYVTFETVTNCVTIFKITRAGWKVWRMLLFLFPGIRRGSAVLGFVKVIHWRVWTCSWSAVAFCILSQWVEAPSTFCRGGWGRCLCENMAGVWDWVLC